MPCICAVKLEEAALALSGIAVPEFTPPAGMAALAVGAGGAASMQAAAEMSAAVEAAASASAAMNAAADLSLAAAFCAQVEAATGVTLPQLAASCALLCPLAG